MIKMSDLKKVLKQEPLLTPNGIDWAGRFKEEWTNTELKQIQICCDYLDLCKTRKTINNNFSSYGLKHSVEAKYKEYVCNGAFIAALILKRIKYKKEHGCLNVYTVLSNKLP